MSPTVVFVGPPGAGKSTVAEIVAGRLGVDVRDTDADIEASQGVSIQDIFIDQGESHFRALEEKAVAAAESGVRVSVSVGALGGSGRTGAAADRVARVRRGDRAAAGSDVVTVPGTSSSPGPSGGSGQTLDRQ